MVDATEFGLQPPRSCDLISLTQQSNIKPEATGHTARRFLAAVDLTAQDTINWNIMLNKFLLCWWMLLGLQVTLTSAYSSSHLEDVNPPLAGVGRYVSANSVRKAKETSFSTADAFTQTDLDTASTDSTEELLFEDASSLENEVLSEDLETRRRVARSPRRCVRHWESCLGHQLPCCDPCATCYCRFFNAICYCRRIGNTCSQGRN
ncbi:agouti-related protein [Polypterus senegalus]|nr:agouti-related protein [Polypterus senegalus]